MLTLRPYQRTCIDKVKEHLVDHRSTLFVAPTGAGKTLTFSYLAKETPGRIMILAHRQILIHQTAEKISQTIGEQCAIEMGEHWSNENPGIVDQKNRIVVSSIQTQISGAHGEGRMSRFRPEEFSLVIVDECFPSGTLIDGRPIEGLRPGDMVKSFNHLNGMVEHKVITRVFKKHCNNILRIRFSNGQSIVCTPNHPFFSVNRYIPAIELDSGSMVHTITEMEENTHAVCNMRKTNSQVAQNMPWRMPDYSKTAMRANKFSHNGGNESQICLRANEEKQSNGSSGNPGENAHEFARYGLETADTWWKWKRTNRPATTARERSWMGNGNCNSNESAEGSRLSNLLQTRHWECHSENRSRGRWGNSLFAQSARLEKRQFIGKTWVESVEIFKSGSNREFTELCPEGFVYNIEIQDNHNYFANGILVHNCHHSPTDSYTKVLDYYRQNPRLKIVGCSATPDRADEEALGKVYETVAFEYELLQAIEDGWLVPIHQRAVYVDSLDFSNVRTTAGDLNGADLAAVMEYEKNLHRVADPLFEIAAGRQTIVFAASVTHAERLAEILCRHQADCARAISAETPHETRQHVFNEFREGRINFIVNVGICSEGFDMPSIAVVAQARPTKSRALYAQQIGRGTRTLPGIIDGIDNAEDRRAAIAASNKKMVEVIDFVGNSGRHTLVSSADILGGNFSDEEIALVKEDAKKEGQPRDVIEALRAAKRALEAEKAREAAKRQHIIGKAAYSTKIVDPFNVFGLSPARPRGWDTGKLISDKQRAVLTGAGIDNIDAMTFSQVSQLIGEIFTRREKKLCTFKQARLLKKYGYDTNMTFEQASRTMDALKRNNWKPLPVAPGSFSEGCGDL